jgi:hypothetical protein
MTRKYTKSKKRISNKRNSKRRISKRSKRSKRINNKSKKLTKKIQKGGDDNIIDVSANSEDSIQKTIDSLAKFKSEIKGDYKNYKDLLHKKKQSCDKLESSECKKSTQNLENNNNLTRRFYKSIRNVLKDMNHKKGDLDSTDIKNLQAIITLFLKKYNNTDFMYKFMYKEFDIDNLFQNQKYENENIFYNLLKSTLKDLNIQKKKDEVLKRQLLSKSIDGNSQIIGFEKAIDKSLKLISKDFKRKYVEFLFNSIKNKIDNLTSSSTTSTTSQQQQQQQIKQ